jgi:uncharacterized membrane protein YkoI
MKQLMFAVALAIAATAAQAHNEAQERAEAAKTAPALAAALKDSTLSLADGIKASESEGTPISAKYELEDGKLQLSVYTMKGDKFFEVIVDHKTGKVAKTEPITGGEDLEAAKAQAKAMGKTKRALAEVAAKAEQGHAGYRVVNVHAEIEHGRAEADMTLLKGSQPKHVEEKL